MLSIYLLHYVIENQTETLTVFPGLNVENIAADSISGLSVGQNLDTVVGELLKPAQLNLFTCGGDILHLAPFCGVDGELFRRSSWDWCEDKLPN